MAERHPAARDGARLAAGGAYLRAGGDGLALSAAAYRFHLYALADSAVAGAPGFVPAAYVAGREGGEAALRELLAHGLWEPSGEGYRALDEEALANLVATYAQAGRIAEGCVDGTGHLPDADNPGLCARCHGTLPEITGG